jgi:2-polyprenyl-3-methyl-5-hydroxy-6-metoxy-1,4-benzoquinol methylase
MFEQQPETLRQTVQQLSATASIDPTGWFDTLYQNAQGDAAQVPWAKLAPHPYLQDWLMPQSQPPESACALVIGCGLGDDAERLQGYGYTVRAFDVSPTAIAWCQQRFPQSNVHYTVADLLNLDSGWQPADFVFECRNIQALPLEVRSRAIRAIAKLVAPQGTLLVITRLRADESIPDGPPWPLSESELAEFIKLGLKEVNRVQFLEGNPAITQLRIEYRR